MLTHLLRLKGVESDRRKRARSHELLERVHLAHRASRPVKSYAGGMRQRLGIAQRAWARRPSVATVVIPRAPSGGVPPEVRFDQLNALIVEDHDVPPTVMAAALIDRLPHHSHIVNIRVNRYRMREHRALAVQHAVVRANVETEL